MFLPVNTCEKFKKVRSRSGLWTALRWRATPSTSANINLHLCQCGVRCQIIVVKSPLRHMCASLMLLIEVSIPSLHVLMLIWSSDFHVKILTFERSYSRLFRLQLVLAEEIINRKCFACSKRKYRIRSGWSEWRLGKASCRVCNPSLHEMQGVVCAWACDLTES
jgi:hypothetical protein